LVKSLGKKNPKNAKGMLPIFPPRKTYENPRDVSCVRISARGGANRGATRHVLSRALLSFFFSVISLHGR